MWSWIHPLTTGLFVQKIHIFTKQRALYFPQKSPIFPQTSHTRMWKMWSWMYPLTIGLFLQRSPIRTQESPYFPAKEPYISTKEPWKTVVRMIANAPGMHAMTKLSSYTDFSAKEPYISAKEPWKSVVDTIVSPWCMIKYSSEKWQLDDTSDFVMRERWLYHASEMLDPITKEPYISAYNFIDPADRSHPVADTIVSLWCITKACWCSTLSQKSPLFVQKNHERL